MNIQNREYISRLTNYHIPKYNKNCSLLILGNGKQSPAVTFFSAPSTLLHRVIRVTVTVSPSVHGCAFRLVAQFPIQRLTGT